VWRGATVTLPAELTGVDLMSAPAVAVVTVRRSGGAGRDEYGIPRERGRTCTAGEGAGSVSSRV